MPRQDGWQESGDPESLGAPQADGSSSCDEAHDVSHPELSTGLAHEDVTLHDIMDPAILEQQGLVAEGSGHSISNEEVMSLIDVPVAADTPASDEVADSVPVSVVSPDDVHYTQAPTRDLGIVESEHRRIKGAESYCTRKE
ncbi:hypothetical protein V6N12_058014 [Hibiscus sabdariffa]|uniref:Uncharacterized protein n=1 Tax=Hibiscus sabdariffa TaxID=183260 RepID=A0ABR2AEU3_9ROSI